MLIAQRNGMAASSRHGGEYWGLCFTAEDPEVSVSLHANSASAPQVNLLYSTNAVKWQTFTPDSTTVVLANVGDKVWFKAGPGGNAGMGSSTSNSHSFRIENGRAYGSGSIMSLLSGEAETYEIPAGQQGCFAMLFGSTTIPNTTCLLTHSPNLPATTLGRNCYRAMFQGCTSLTAAPALPATTLAEKCYHSMFMYCTSLSVAPALPATTLANECYYHMFQGCSALISASELSATDLSSGCYQGMFQNCYSLTQAPAMSATSLADNCYHDMFYGCSSLTSVPALPLTNLVNSCYAGMFYGCTSITQAPELPATILTSNCYNNMFQGCSSLTSISASFTEWTSSTTTNWVNGVAANGTFYCSTSLSDVYDASHIPVGWTREPPLNVNAVKFENIGSTTGVIRITGTDLALSDKADWEYSSEGSTWTQWDKTLTDLSVNAGDSLYVRAGDTGQSRLATSDSFNAANKILPMSSSFKVSGPLSSLLSKNGTIPAGQTQYQFASLFLQGTGLVDASELELPSTVDEYSFARTFGITGLSAAPVLPATTLAYGCYFVMFGQCSYLSTPPALPATTLADSCYRSMFNGCSSLTAAPALPATTLANYCYSYMFYGCTSLSTPPALSATTLASNCYQYMFQSCTSLTSTGNLKTYSMYPTECYSYMFSNDTALISAIFPTAWDSDLTAMFANDIGGASTMFDGCDASQVWVTYINGADWLSSFLPQPPAAVEGVKFTNVDGNNTIDVSIFQIGDPENNGGGCELVYSTDGENWSSYTVEDTISLYSQGDYVIFKAAYPYQSSGLRSVDDYNYYQFIVNNGVAKVEGDISYLYSYILQDSSNYLNNDYQFAHLFDSCEFSTDSGNESKIKLPSARVWWYESGRHYAFKDMFSSATISRIEIPADPDGYSDDWNDNFTNWVASISNGNDSNPTIWIPYGMSDTYDDSAVPYGWFVEYST